MPHANSSESRHWLMTCSRSILVTKCLNSIIRRATDAIAWWDTFMIYDVISQQRKYQTWVTSIKGDVVKVPQQLIFHFGDNIINRFQAQQKSLSQWPQNMEEPWSSLWRTGGKGQHPYKIHQSNSHNYIKASSRKNGNSKVHFTSGKWCFESEKWFA